MPVRLLFSALLPALVLAPPAARAQGSAPDPRSEVLASFMALQSAPSYRMTMTVEPSSREAAEFDFPSIVTEVAGGRQRTDFRLDIEGMDLRMLTVVEPGRAAARLESKALEEMKRAADAQMAQSIQQSVVSGVVGFLTGGFDPFSLVNMAVGFAMQKAMGKMTEDMGPMKLNEWKCHDLEAAPADPVAPDWLANVEPLGEESIDGIPVNVYRVTMQGDGETYHMRLSTLGAGGLPHRMEVSSDDGAATIDYHDFGAEIAIDFPDCD